MRRERDKICRHKTQDMNFSYTARNKQARLEHGILDAENAVEAYDLLRKQGLYPTHLKATRTSLKDKIAMKLLKSFLTSQTGWLTRKGVELVTIGVTSAAAFAISKGVPDELVNSGTTFLIGVGGYLVSLVLSKVAEQANKEAPPPAK